MYLPWECCKKNEEHRRKTGQNIENSGVERVVRRLCENVCVMWPVHDQPARMILPGYMGVCGARGGKDLMDIPTTIYPPRVPNYVVVQQYNILNTFIHPNLPFASSYLYPHSFTPSCLYLPSFTFIHPQLPSSRFISIHSTPIAVISLHLH